MTIAIISDTHIGDRSSRLLDKNGTFTSSNPCYCELKEKIFNFTKRKPLEFLVLSGDIMDFSINSIDSSINLSRPFFQQLSSDKLTKRIVYIPGNHDKQVWDGVQWDTSIIGNLSDNRPAKQFTRIQPAVISSFNTIELEGIYPKSKGKYGNIFLKGLFDTSFNNPQMILAYPNLYIKMEEETILVTHGHMFETIWTIISTLFKGVSGLPDNIGFKELEEWNIPLSSMIATGLGSAGKVSDLFYRIEREIYENKSSLLSQTLGSILPRIKDELNLPWYKKILIPDWLIKKIILAVAMKAEDPREYNDYLGDKNNKQNFSVFFEASKKELERLKLPPVNKIIFGHTHHPFSRNNPYITENFPGLKFFNTGGWLQENRAEIFLIDQNRFESSSV